MTDALKVEWTIFNNFHFGSDEPPISWPNFARDLERKLAQVTEERDELTKQLNAEADYQALLREERDDYKDAASGAVAKWGDAISKLQYVAGQLIEAGLDDGASPIEKMARRAVVLNQQHTDALYKLAKCREALQTIRDNAGCNTGGFEWNTEALADEAREALEQTK